MFFTKKKENEVIDYLAHMSVLSDCATSSQMDALLAKQSSRALKIFERFSRQRSIFRDGIPRSQCTCDRGDAGYNSDNPQPCASL